MLRTIVGDVYILQPEKDDVMEQKEKTEEEAEVFFPPLAMDIDPRFTLPNTHHPHNSHPLPLSPSVSSKSKLQRRKLN